MVRCSLCGGEILDRSDSRYCVYCNSTYHRSCIIEHFYRNKYCPVCNKKMSLIFMRYGLPPEPAVPKRPVPKEIRKPKWPQLERRTEVPVFEIEIPSGPLKRTDKYIPKPRKKRAFPKLPRKVPVKLLAVVLIIVVGGISGYYALNYVPITLPGKEKPAESPWKVVWEYPLEGVSDIAASDYGIVIGSRDGLTVLGLEGDVLWQKEGVVSDVDIKDEVVVASNRGIVEIYTIEEDELARYGEGTCDSVSLSKFGILVTGFSDGGVHLLDIYGNIFAEYDTGVVGCVSMSSDGTTTAYREGGTVYALDVLGEVLYAFEDGGSGNARILATTAGYMYAHTGSEIFLYDGENVVWSAEAGGCEPAGLAVSEDETQFAVNADEAVLYSADGQLLYVLPEGSCGGIAFSGEDIIVSDPGTVYYLRKEVLEEEGEEGEPEEPGEEREEGEEEEEEEGEKTSELGSYEDWFTWYQGFLSVAGNTAEYDFTAEEDGEIDIQMKVQHFIEGTEGDNLIETITMMVGESKTIFKRWIGPDGSCVKAEMILGGNVESLKCDDTTVRGIDLRQILSLKGQWEYLGTEEITVGKGTFLCHKLQVSTNSGVLTIWVTDGLPPARITLEEGSTVVTMELT